MLEDDELQSLADDIKENGLLIPISLYEGKILDGRNRYQACLLAKADPTFTEYTGDNPIKFVYSMNEKRRHQTTSQRAMAAAKIANLPDGVRKDRSANLPTLTVTQPEAARELKVSERSVRSAKAVLDHGTPELIAAVERGRIPVSKAASISKKEESEQKSIVEIVNNGNTPQEAERKYRASLAKEAAALPSTKYRVIYADPPWSYGNTQPDYHPEQRDHYPVMSLSDICKLPVSDMSENDAVLFLWVTSPILEYSFKVIKAWGFTYKASFVWDKIKHNMGHYNSVRHEFLLICVKGSCQPDERKLFDSVVSVERTEHSKKPDEFRKIIDTIYPIGKRVEMFARGKSEKGWDRWGNE